MLVGTLSALGSLVLATSAARSAPGAAPPPSGSVAATIERLSVAQAMLAAQRGELVFVDVRVDGQRSLGHIAGDTHIPLAELATRAKELPAAKKWVFYCSCAAEESALEAAALVTRSAKPRVAVLVGGYDAWRLAGGSVRVDADWEQVFRVADPPSGWGKTPVDTARCRYARDTGAAYRGGASACVTCVPAAEARGFAGFSQKLDARPLRGASLTLSAILKTEKLERHAFLWIAVEDAQGRARPISPPDAAPITGTKDWHPVQVSGAVPADAVSVLVGVSLVTAGRLWMDDVRLVADAPGRSGVRVVLQNHGFEDE